jgi:hypothetical protein
MSGRFTTKITWRVLILARMLHSAAYQFLDRESRSDGGQTEEPERLPHPPLLPTRRLHTKPDAHAPPISAPAIAPALHLRRCS